MDGRRKRWQLGLYTAVVVALALAAIGTVAYFVIQFVRGMTGA